MANYLPGMEPEKLKMRIETLFQKLDSAYPDKRIVGLHNEHKKWGEAVTKLYRELGYPDGKSFLESYGYKYEKKETSGGRPKSVDPKAVIKALQDKYPDGSPFDTSDELFEANPEYLPQLKTIKNSATATFGMPLGKYLISIGLILTKTKFEPTKKKNHIICKIKPVGTETSLYYVRNTKSIHEKDIVEIPIGICNYSVFGIVEEIIKCDDDTAPCDIDTIMSVSCKVGIREYTKGMFVSALHANAAVATDNLINCCTAYEFSESDTENPKIDDTIQWAYIRGLSTEVLNVLDYLIKKDDQTYKYTDIILCDIFGISELFVFSEDVQEIMTKYPDIKMAMFAENEKNGIVNLYYSRSGASTVTDSYYIGPYDPGSKSKWTVKHLPTEDFKDGEINFEFKFADDWNAINYVFTDKNNSRKQLRK